MSSAPRIVWKKKILVAQTFSIRRYAPSHCARSRNARTRSHSGKVSFEADFIESLPKPEVARKATSISLGEIICSRFANADVLIEFDGELGLDFFTRFHACHCYT
jgi:hypothetical protein